MKPRFFRSAAAFRTWLEAHHDTASELMVGFYKKDSGKGGLTYGEALEEALCLGWIDGVRRRVDDVSFTNRFTPRRPGSNWSAVNIRRVRVLAAQGRMHPAGVRAFEAADPKRARQYSYERESCELAAAHVALFKRSLRAWRFFQSQPPSYRRVAAWFVISAKREETRRRRLSELIETSAQGKRLRQFTPEPKRHTRTP